MTVKELIEKLKQFDGNQKAVICQHGREPDLEVIGCCEEEVFGENDEVIEKVVSLYEY